MAGERIILTLFAQIALILALSRVLGWIVSRFGQPYVLGEMIAGVILGPSLLGWAAPQAFSHLFPADSVQILAILSHIGLIFFVFLMGLQLDPALLKAGQKSTISVGIATIAIPLVLGFLVTIPFYGSRIALFVAIALGVNAFPVLARILAERNLHRSQVGRLSISAAAVNNLTIWVILGILLLIGRGSIRMAIGAAIYLAAIALLIRPLLARLQLLYQQQTRISHNVLAAVVLLLLATAYSAHWIGLHPLMGAFALGLVVPKNPQFIRQLTEKFEDFILVCLLPVFLTYVGLNTDVRLINSAGMAAVALLIFVVACAGKIGAGMLTARISNIPWRDSAALGILLNTRGLVLLVILSIGRELQLIPAPLFAVLVFTALLTTGMTRPLLDWIYPARSLIPAETAKATDFCILIPIALPKSGGPLVQIADALIGPARDAGKLLALHLRRPAQHEVFHPSVAENEASLVPLLSQAQARDLDVEPITFTSSDVPSDIAQTTAGRGVNLVMMGYHNPVFGKAMLGGTVHRVLSTCPSDVAVFVDRGLRNIDRILVPYLGSVHDALALELAARIVRNTSARATILHVVQPMSDSAANSAEAKRAVEKIFQNPPDDASIRFQIIEDSSPAGVVLHQARDFDLVIIGVAEEWGLESRLFGWRPEKIARDCPASLLIARKFAKAEESVARAKLEQPAPTSSPTVAM